MSIEKMREEFEAWYAKRFGPGCDLRSGWAMERWEAWQASRAALVIELPRSVAYEGAYDNLKHSEFVPALQDVDSADEIYSLCRTVEVREAIEAAGVKCK